MNTKKNHFLDYTLLPRRAQKILKGTISLEPTYCPKTSLNNLFRGGKGIINFWSPTTIHQSNQGQTFFPWV